jgi:hypothetical protein
VLSGVPATDIVVVDRLADGGGIGIVDELVTLGVEENGAVVVVESEGHACITHVQVIHVFEQS